MKILSIGNSFSQDAHRYLHRVAKNDGCELKTVNLYIGGCSLRTHYLNMLGDKAAYDLEFNGESTEIKVSIKQALESVDWDIVTLQQVSRYSAKQETYSPYIEELARYVKKYCPHCKIFLHETWAYEEGSELLENVAGYHSPCEMLHDIQNAYVKAANSIQADGIIPCGTAMLKAISLGIEKIHRDTFHASLGAGRYLLALTWYKALTGKDISQNLFNDFDEPVTQEEREIVIKAVNFALK
ncbi:MAG: DUF4886 domain-containing protein [Clostridia bacterium]|nr:DUF4886 domain-containing protein [Clostridia bacterium]